MTRPQKQDARRPWPRRVVALLGCLALAGASGGPASPARAQDRVAALSPLGILLPDGDFVYGPPLIRWDAGRYIRAKGGFLARYYEPVDGALRSGAEIVQQVAEDYSVSPRLLLALIELHSGWVTDPAPAETHHPLGGSLPGLAPGLAAAADTLNAHFYAHRHEGAREINGVGTSPVANAATYALLVYLGQDRPGPAPTADPAAVTPSASPTALPEPSPTPALAPIGSWAGLEGPSRFHGAWMSLFEDPLPLDLVRDIPEPHTPLALPLPFVAGEIWYFTRGPQSPWGAGGPRARIDLAPPPSDRVDCGRSEAWVRAVAAGRVMRSRPSGLMVDLDDDGFVETGWVHVYSHLAGLERVPEGTFVQVGDPLGHPSCEGAPSAFARVGFARRLHGAWIPTDSERFPMIMGGWAVLPADRPGEGWMVREGMPTRRAAPVKDNGQNGIFDLALIGGTG